MVAISAFIGDFQHIGFRFYGSNSISSGNAFQLISYPAAGSNTFYLSLYAVLVGILNLYRQLAIFIQASFHASNLGIGINNTDCNLCTIFTYQFIGINNLALTCSCPYLFNNLILQACLTCFTVNGLCHGDIIGVERFDNSVKFTYSNSAHGLLALHFGIVALMYRIPASATLFPLIIISMINKRCKQFNMLAGANLYMRMS